jgi:hypothetical protein
MLEILGLLFCLRSPVLIPLYGSEFWRLKRREIGRTDTVEIALLIADANYMMEDYIGNKFTRL